MNESERSGEEDAGETVGMLYAAQRGLGASEIRRRGAGAEALPREQSAGVRPAKRSRSPTPAHLLEKMISLRAGLRADLAAPLSAPISSISSLCSR